MSSDPESPIRQPARDGLWPVFLTLALVLAALVAFESSRTGWRTADQETAPARWIWADVLTRLTPPQAFYAVKNFELPEVPDAATLTVLGDEEYLLFLNGRAVGSNGYASGADLDRYEVASFLRRGTNRLVAHLRSGSGNGAFLAALWVGETDVPLVVSDESWTIAHHRGPGLLDPEVEIGWPHRAVVVAVPPAGRWGATSRGVERPLLRDLVAGRRRFRAYRIRLPGSRWSGAAWRQHHGESGLGEEVLFDFGRQRSGFLTLRFPPGEPTVAIVYLGVEVPAPAERPPEVTVITSRGEDGWTDVVPRTFRYALVVGLDQVTDAGLVRSDNKRLPPILAGEPVEGVFGLEAPRLRTPAEDIVWRELQRLSGDPEG